MALDIKIFFILNNLIGHLYLFDKTVIFLAEYLQYILIILFLVLIYRPQERLYIFLMPLVSAIIARFAIVTLIRLFYHRPRPFMAYQVHQLIAENEWSFPSGHSAFFFALATGIYFYNKKWGVGFFLAAVLMNFSRIIAGVHYPSDILGGMIIGMIVAYIIFHFAEGWKQKEINKIS